MRRGKKVKASCRQGERKLTSCSRRSSAAAFSVAWSCMFRYEVAAEEDAGRETEWWMFVGGGGEVAVAMVVAEGLRVGGVKVSCDPASPTRVSQTSQGWGMPPADTLFPDHVYALAPTN